MITEESVREAIETARIEDVVGDFVRLKRRGNNYSGLCPFHNEKTPSFNVNPARNIYKCFGCGVGGDPVKFLMELEQLTFPEAIRWIAGKYNLKLEEKEVSQEMREELQEKDSLYLVNDFARQFFERQLHQTDEGKSIGLSYFKGRGFLTETMKTFGLGFAPNAKDALRQAALAAGYKEDKLEKLGLVRNGRDFFRDRVMFTIHNLGGKPIAFAGRILRKDAKAPKYVNSPESEIYHKSDVLFGMYQARQQVRKEDRVYMVEGYTDVISLHQNGVKNVVATSGTSLTDGQARLVKRFTDNVTLLYDGDKAGIKAALRGVDVLLLAGLNVRVVILPDGEDPDSYMQSVGSTAFRKYLEETAKDFLFFKADLLLAEAGEDVAARTSVIKDVAGTVSLITDPLKRQGYLQQFARRLGIGEELLIGEVNKAISGRRAQARKEEERRARERQRQQRRQGGGAPGPESWPEEGWPGEEQSYVPPPDFDGAEHPPGKPAEALDGHGFQEKHLAELLIRFGHKPLEKDGTTTTAAFLIANVSDLLDMFDNPLYLKVVRETQGKGAPDPEFFLTHRDEDIRDLAASATVRQHTMSKNWKERYGLRLSQKAPEDNHRLAAETFLVNFRLRKLDRKIKETVEKLRTAESEKEIRKYLKLQQRLGQMLAETSARVGNVVVR